MPLDGGGYSLFVFMRANLGFFLFPAILVQFCQHISCGSTDQHEIHGIMYIDRSHFLDKLLHNYSRQISPHGDKPTMVDLGIYINSFYSISEQTMDYSVNIYLRQQWYDPRLQFEPHEAGNKSMIKLADYMWDRLWVPDVFFRNEKRANFHHITIPNRLMRLHSDGRIWYASKISATLSCMMSLQKYPLDTQRCPMMLESFGHTMATVSFRWLNKSVEKEPNLSMPQFILIDTPVRDCGQNYSTGSYPCLQVDFILKRDIGYFLIQVYVPTILIVILSWVAFWINIEAIPARVSLGLLTVLTMTTQSSIARSSLPRVSYIKAIDVWLSVCLIFVFASLLEFAIVNVFSRRGAKLKDVEEGMSGDKFSESVCSVKRRRPIFNSDQHAITETDLPMVPSVFNESSREDSDDEHQKFLESTVLHELSYLKDINHNQAAQGLPPMPPKLPANLLSNHPIFDTRNQARKVDKLARRFFPLSFLLFNVVYWVMYIIVK